MPLGTRTFDVGVFRDVDAGESTGVVSVTEGIVPRMTGRTGCLQVRKSVTAVTQMTTLWPGRNAVLPERNRRPWCVAS